MTDNSVINISLIILIQYFIHYERELLNEIIMNNYFILKFSQHILYFILCFF